MDRLALEGADIEKLTENWNGKAVSAIHGGKIIGIAGIGMDGNDAFGWMFLSDELRKMPLFLYRSVKRGLEIVRKEFALRKLDVLVLNQFDCGIRFAESLGFRVVDWPVGYVRLRKEWF